MKRLVVISGPQAAGKSTSIKKIHQLLTDVYPCFPGAKPIVPFALQEARQIVVHKYHAMGAIFLTKAQELEMIDIDFGRMKTILGELDYRLLYFDECNIFTLAHAEAHGIKLTDEFFLKYVEYLKALNAHFIFLDIDPDTSWARRKESYSSRMFRFPEGEREGIMGRYREYLQALHPALNRIFDRLDLPKIKISAHKSNEKVVKEIIEFLTSTQVL